MFAVRFTHHGFQPTKLALVAVGCLWTIGCSEPTEPGFQITSPVDPFPPLSETVGVTAMIDGMGTPVPEFDVPKNHWAAIRSAMLPAELDKELTVWEILGTLKIATKHDSEFKVQMYFVGGVGAFSIDGIYYRGGSSEKLNEAIRRAHQFAGDEGDVGH